MLISGTYRHPYMRAMLLATCSVPFFTLCSTTMVWREGRQYAKHSEELGQYYQLACRMLTSERRKVFSAHYTATH
jgi:hypothetical protein